MGGDNSKLEEENQELKSEIGRKKRKIHELQDKISNAQEPPRKRIRRAPVVCFTGFKSGNRLCNLEMKKKLKNIVANLGGINYSEINVEDRVTHVVTSQYSRTMKILQGIVKRKWIVSVDWLLDSQEQAHFLPEDSYGYKRSENPMFNKKIYLSPSFQRDHKSNAYQNCRSLISFAEGTFVNNPDLAHFILITNLETGNDRKRMIKKHKKAYVVTWAELIDIMYPPYLEKKLFVKRRKPSNDMEDED